MEQNQILNAANAHVDGAAFELGAWLGRHQAFGLIANKYSAISRAEEALIAMWGRFPTRQPPERRLQPRLAAPRPEKIHHLGIHTTPDWSIRKLRWKDFERLR